MSAFEPIAIVSAAGVFPGAADLPELWRLIHGSRSAIAEIPAERWGRDPATLQSYSPDPDRVLSRRAGLIAHIPPLPEGLDLPSDIEGQLDPLHRLVLAAGSAAWAPLQTPSALRRRTAVILAAIALPTESACTLTRELFERALSLHRSSAAPSPPLGPLPAGLLTASRVTALPALLLARALGLGGAAYTLDAACASSLFAVKLACDELQTRRADAVIAGGVSRPDSLYTHMGFTQLRALSASGRCAPFDASADGLVVGEGIGLVVLKRLADALRDGDHVRAVVRGVGLSNDMRGNLLAPDTEGQLRAMQAAYRQALWPVTGVDLIECHGAGTPRGDAVELQSLTRLWQDAEWQAAQCAIGSVKSNLGHLLTAAGAAGLVKVLLALEHAVLPPSLHFERPAPGSPLLHESPFRIPTRPDPWQPRDPRTLRRAAVSAFGFGGINAHLLLEEAPAAPSPDPLPPFPAPQAQGSDAAPPDPPAVAVVGLAARVGPWIDLPAMETALLDGRSALGPRPRRRWKHLDAALPSAVRLPQTGAYLEELAVAGGHWAIPPKEIPQILPQHLLMLSVAAAALADAGQPLKAERPRAGVVVGMGFDFEATDFHLRWCLTEIIERHNRRQGSTLDAASLETWASQLREGLPPPLTPEGTLGALGSVIASRLAREFRFGGPSFTVAAESLSGLQALEIGARALERGECDLVVAGAVDLAGDPRQLLIDAHRGALSPEGLEGGLAGPDLSPGEGACAVILKRLEDARVDGDRIYAVLRGRGWALDPVTPKAAPAEAWERCRAGSDDSPANLGYLELQGGPPAPQAGRPSPRRSDPPAESVPSLAYGALEPLAGHTGAAAGLLGFVKAALCLHRRLQPPALDAFGTGDGPGWPTHGHRPRETHYWYRDRTEGPRRAGVQARTPEGLAAALLLEEPPALPRPGTARPAGTAPALFRACGADPSRLMDDLAALSRHLTGCRADGVPLPEAARRWRAREAAQTDGPWRAVLAAGAHEPIPAWLEEARRAVAEGRPCRLEPSGGVCFTPRPLNREGRLALVYPGSGSHFVGMGRRLGAVWPDILEAMDRETDHLRRQAHPHLVIPHRRAWPRDWERRAQAELDARPLEAICATVVFGILTTRLVQAAGLRPQGVIGYSLGESTGYFATGAWPDQGRMLERIQFSTLFREQLAGPHTALRQAWNLPADAAPRWQAAVVNRAAEAVREVLPNHPHVRLLIANTPAESVIGGLAEALPAFLADIGGEAVPLQGVLPLHCDAVRPVLDAYRELHTFPTAPPPEMTYYSAASGAPIELTNESAADSIAQQALEGFDFGAVIRRAHADGFRIFLEMGPQGSCSRMIDRILADAPHLALSVSQRGEDEALTLAKTLAVLDAEGLAADPAALFAMPEASFGHAAPTLPPAGEVIRVPVGRPLTLVPPPLPVPQVALPAAHSAPPAPAPPPGATEPWIDLHQRQVTRLEAQARETAATHQRFLEFSDGLMEAYRQGFDLQMRILAQAGPGTVLPTPAPEARPPEIPHRPAYSRDLCLEFAVGSAARVLGPEFAAVDGYPVRVRLPDEPLMLVDRIVSVEGEKGSLTAGRVVTEHDVLPGAWYLDGGRAPVCIAVEAGQADLFLSAYLGIDLAVQGTRAYRLLDATVTFHRGLPHPGETIRYDIAIDRFIRQGPTWMFFFRFTGTIDGQPLITMRDGCAGFFTPDEVRRSGGILLTEAETRPEPGKAPADWSPPVPMAPEAYDEEALEALRRGDAGGCFGEAFAGVRLPDNLRLPKGRMRLIHRVRELDPRGGRYGMGVIRAEADIRPDDWFLTCHFVDDMVMPGTLMYECCAHALRVLLLRMGWVTQDPEARWEPLTESPAVLKCRGPVTPETRQVVYEVELKAIGFDPAPYALADAHMFADGRRIVLFRGLSLRLAGATREGIEAFWRARRTPRPDAPPTPAPAFDRRHILAFAGGRPSEAFGPPYRPFDQGRFIARLPVPPYSFIDRVPAVAAAPWVLTPGGGLTAEYDVPPDAWYFRANGGPVMPLAVLMEIALQACGFLAAYMGSALLSAKDLHFRNLDGEACIHRNVGPGDGTLATRVRLLKAARAADILIEHFEFEVRRQGEPVYSGTTSFGFFTPEALAGQAGLRPAPEGLDPFGGDAAGDASADLEDLPPRDPDDPSPGACNPFGAPGRALRMVDGIEAWRPGAGDRGRNYLRGFKRIDPQEWFFRAHFFQDPVWPGSLGIEALLQLIRHAAGRRSGGRVEGMSLELLTGQPHRWQYRGQVLPTNRRAVVEALVAESGSGEGTVWRGDGYLQADGLYIYKMQDFGLRARK